MAERTKTRPPSTRKAVLPIEVQVERPPAELVRADDYLMATELVRLDGENKRLTRARRKPLFTARAASHLLRVLQSSVLLLVAFGALGKEEYVLAIFATLFSMLPLLIKVR